MTSSVAGHESHPPAGHGEGLGHRVELDGHLLGPFGLEDRRRHVAVEADLGVGVVVHHHDLVLAGEVDHVLHEVEIDAGGGGVVGERHHDDAGLGPRVVPCLGQALEEVGAGAQGHLADVGAGQQRAVDVDGVRRRRHQGGVAGLEQGPHQVREPLLGADGVDDLGLGVELDAEAPEVEVGVGLAQLGDALAGRVAVVAWVVHRLGQLLDRHVG